MANVVDIKIEKVLLLKLMKELSKKSFINLGVFSNSRSDGKDNLEIAARHELGIGVPRRSFLLFPLLFRKSAILEFMNNSEKHIKFIITKGLDAWLGQVMISCMSIINNGFSSGGYGQWKVLSPLTIRKKKNAVILIDTGDMLKSITSIVVRKSN